MKPPSVAPATLKHGDSRPANRSGVIFAVSLAVNVAIVALFALRPSLAPAAWRDTLAFGANRTSDEAQRAAAAKAASPAPPRKLWPVLATDDLPTLIARLRAAGFPASVIREIVRAQVSARYDPQLRALTEPDPNTPFWKAPAYTLRYGTPKWEDYSRLQRERARVLRELLADPFFANEAASGAQRRQFGNLSQQKIDAVQRIEDDYADMNAAIRASTHGVLLAEDRGKLAFLAREKRADLAAVLTPAELADYELRSSPITRMLSSELREFRPTEAEFRALFAMHQGINDRLPQASLGSVNFTELRDIHQQLAKEFRAQVGEARYNDYVRETSTEFQQLRRMVERENLPPETAVRAFDLRNTVSQDSMRIYNDATLSNEQKRAALAALAENARNQILTTLGPAVGPNYVNTLNNQWLRALERGSAITFDGGPNRTFSSDNVMISMGQGASYHSVPGNAPTPRP